MCAGEEWSWFVRYGSAVEGTGHRHHLEAFGWPEFGMAVVLEKQEAKRHEEQK